MPLPTIPELEDKFFDPALGLRRYHGDVEVRPLVDGEAYFHAVADALDRCLGPGDKIYITSWLFSPRFDLRAKAGTSGSGPHLGTLLVDKAHQGADVRIILGAPYFSTGTQGLSPLSMLWVVNRMVQLFDAKVGIRDVVDNNVAEARLLRKAQREASRPLEGSVLLDWGGRHPDSRHDKSTLIYSASTQQLRAFVGGIDFLDERISDPRHTPPHSDAFSSWHDAGVELFGSAAQGVLDNFITRWTETVTLPQRSCMRDGVVEDFNPPMSLAPPSAPANVQHPQTPEGASVRVLRSYDSIRALQLWDESANLAWHSLPGAPIREIQAVLLRACARAERYIYIEDQTLNPRSDIWYYAHSVLFPALSAACARGVRVILVCYDALVNGVAPLLSPEIRQRILDPLTPAARDNLALFWVQGTRLHSKVVLVDDEFACVGSANAWDRSMAGVESELNAAYVHDGGEDSKVADLRVQLWLEHLHLLPPTAAAHREIRALASGLAVFRPAWGTAPLTIPTPDNALRAIAP